MLNDTPSTTSIPGEETVLQLGTITTTDEITERYTYLQPNKYIFDATKQIELWTRKDAAPIPTYCLNPYDQLSCPHEIQTYINTLYSILYSTALPDPPKSGSHLPQDLRDLQQWIMWPYGNLPLYRDVTNRVGSLIPVKQYESDPSQTKWKWMAWPTAYPPTSAKRQQPATSGSVTTQGTPVDMDITYEVYKLQFRQNLIMTRYRTTSWSMKRTQVVMRLDKKGNARYQINWNDTDDQPTDEQYQWCTAAILVKEPDTTIQLLQDQITTLGKNLRRNLGNQTSLSTIQANVNAIQTLVHTLNTNYTTLSEHIQEHTKNLNDMKINITKSIQVLQQHIHNNTQKLQNIAPGSSSAPNKAIQNTIDTIQLNLNNVQETQKTLTTKHTQQVASITTIQTKNSDHVSNFEPYLNRLVQQHLNATNWIKFYETNGIILRQLTQIQHKYNQFIEQQNKNQPEEHHYKPKGVFDFLGDIFTGFADALSIGKSIKNLTVDEYNSTIADIASATTAIRNVTATVRDITGTVANIQSVIDKIKTDWSTNKDQLQQTITKVQQFEKDGREEIADLGKQLAELAETKHPSPMVLRKNDILP